jgi:DNA invertase Pin-like site-specific DNA recombinase
MSTDDQKTSLTFQKQVIRTYASSHGLEVLVTYSDPGRSGVEIKHRPGLRQLIQDVIGGKCVYRAILVYDVSRWGRFQDVDESMNSCVEVPVFQSTTVPSSSRIMVRCLT